MSISKAGFLLILTGLAFSCKPERNDLELTKFLIDSIQSQTIPDTRTEVFSIKATFADKGILLKGKTTNTDALAKLQVALKVQNVNYIDSIVRLPDDALKGKIWGLITLSVANLRYNPAHSAEMATQALLGTPVKVLQEENGWFLIQTPDNYIAWTESAGISLRTREQMDEWKASERIIFLGSNSSILNSPDPLSRPVSDIVTGGILTVTGPPPARGTILPVELPDGRKGFVNRAEYRNFREWSAQVTPDSVIMEKMAFNQMGKPYLWGGTSVKGFDCSGFTKSIYLTGGMVLSRDASQQVLQGTEIATDAIWKGLKCGDLLFFGRKKTSAVTEKVSHVGMYIGGSEFIHCSGLVRVNSLDSTRTNFKPYYLTNLLHVRRMINSSLPPQSFKAHPWYN